MQPAAQRRKRGAFTLVELLVAAAIFSILLIVLATLIAQISKAWSYTSSKADQFREARNGFEAMTRRLSQATLNTYLNYVDSSGNPRSYTGGAGDLSSFVPANYVRQSNLRFISGPGLAGSTATSPVRPTHAVFFQAPLGFVADPTYGGLANLLNTWGYYIEFNSDAANQPSFVSGLGTYQTRYRYRLMEMMEPSESLSLYKYTAANPGLTSSGTNGKNWFTDPLNASPTYAHVLAENIVALIILPRLSANDQAAQTQAGTPGGDGMLAPSYSYDSTSAGQGVTNGALNSKAQLPPLVQITMIAVDEASSKRLQGTSTTAPNLGLGTLFQTVGDTTDPSQPGLARDLQTLQTTLQSQKLNYRVFTTTVAIKAAKWSREQKN